MALGGPADCPDLGALREHIGDCHRCPLGDTRTKLVFGVGDPHARLLFIGEAPGRNEDLKGEPFVGAAGKLLDELLAHIGYVRSQVYIANVLKCRPPNNRDPLPDEIETCTPFLARQIELIDPIVIATLGKFATQYVLDTTAPISALRGRLYRVGGRPVVPVFHPAAALYDSSKRSVLLDDFSRLKAVIDRARTADSAAAGPGDRFADADGARGQLPLFVEGEAPGAGGTIVTASAAETHRAGLLLGRLTLPDDVIALAGGLGAGKTALVQGIADGLGIVGHVPSPTFNILLVHRGDRTLFHFDLYRLESPEQLEDVDFYETLESGGVSAIEWADNFPAQLPPDRLDVTIQKTGGSERCFTPVGHGPRAAALAAHWLAAWKHREGS